MEKTKLLNTYVNNVTLKEAVEFLLQKIRQQTPAYVVEVNVDVVVKMEQDTVLRKITNDADLTLVDGQPSKRSTGKTLYILDEPTTGLHTHDVAKLIAILQRLVSSGNTVVVIEHNLDVIKVADNIVDLGPDGGDRGGTIVDVGTPEHIAENEKSYTGQFLKRILK